MKISIITPNYNGARWLARCMDSVLSQELAPGDELEYLFMDGVSTDDSVAIAESRRDRLAALVSEKDTGPAEALNKGFSRATGDLIGWLNSDDQYQPGALAKAAAAARAHPPKSFFFGLLSLVQPLPDPVHQLCLPTRLLVPSLGTGSRGRWPADESEGRLRLRADASSLAAGRGTANPRRAARRFPMASGIHQRDPLRAAVQRGVGGRRRRCRPLFAASRHPRPCAPRHRRLLPIHESKG